MVKFRTLQESLVARLGQKDATAICETIERAHRDGIANAVDAIYQHHLAIMGCYPIKPRERSHDYVLRVVDQLFDEKPE